MKMIHVAVVVADYDEALAFYTEKLEFELVEDTQLSENKRWVVVRPPGSECAVLLAKAANPLQMSRVGDQTGGRVFLFLQTDDFWTDYERLRAAGVEFVRAPEEAEYGTVAVFRDLYGNLWDLISAG
ncbi:MAG: VOC family protein [Saprospiraceae bacterium]|nr:VOC family protein [Saprospiraceae bacterium]